MKKVDRGFFVRESIIVFWIGNYKGCVSDINEIIKNAYKLLINSTE